MKHYLSILSIIVTMSFFFGCKSKKDFSNLGEEEVRFYLQKGACFGTCPVYFLTIYQNKTAVFNGEMNVDKKGEYRKTLDDKTFKELQKAFEKADFVNFEKEYKSNVSDLPKITVGYHDGTEYRESSGDMDRPSSLQDLQFMLEKVADSGNWKMMEPTKDKTTKPEAYTIYDEIIIFTKPGTVLKKWLDAHQEQGIRLLKKLGAQEYMYLVTYDTKRFKPQEILDMLNADDQIRLAEFNKEIKSRARR